MANLSTMPAHRKPGRGLVQKHWFISLMLAILLGYIGAERFYFGHYQLAVAKLVLSGVFAGWWLHSPHLTAPKMALLSAIIIWWIVDIAFVAGRFVHGIWWADDARWT